MATLSTTKSRFSVLTGLACCFLIRAGGSARAQTILTFENLSNPNSASGFNNQNAAPANSAAVMPQQTPVSQLPAGATAPLPLDRSTLVRKDAKGQLAVAAANGTPVDASNRVYVTWRSAWKLYMYVAKDASSGNPSQNLVYRVMEGGQWNANPIPIHPPASDASFLSPNSGSASYFVSTDPTGKVHVIWNGNPYRLHPDLLAFGGPAPGIGNGEVMEVDLDGKTPSVPREIYMAAVTTVPNYKLCDGFDTLEGYVDASGEPHYLVKVNATVGHPESTNRINLIEGQKRTPAIEIPGEQFITWVCPPKLLIDAQGRQHIIAMFPGGEHATVRDYLVGSDQEPTIIRASADIVGTLQGFQAFQGPGGTMVALMQMNDTGKPGDAELYVSTSSGGKWSPPVNVTNNSGRGKFKTTQTSSESHVASLTRWYPGEAAAAFDKSGHLLIIHISDRHFFVESNAFGVPIAGGSGNTPTLLFLRL